MVQTSRVFLFPTLVILATWFVNILKINLYKQGSIWKRSFLWWKKALKAGT